MSAPPFDDDGVTVARTIAAQGALAGPGISPSFAVLAAASVVLWGVWGDSAKVYVDRSKDGGATWQMMAGGALAPSASDSVIEVGNTFPLEKGWLYRIRVHRLAGGVVNYAAWT